MDTQLSMFGNIYLSSLVVELDNIWQQKRRYFPDQTEHYDIYKYPNGDILLAIYYKGKKEKSTKEKIIARSVYLEKQASGSYRVAHFNNYCLSSLVDRRNEDLLLNAFIKQIDIINDF